MLNEVITNKRLDSPAFGSLIHAIEVTSATLKADITAGKIFGTSAPEASSYVSTNRINLNNAEIDHLHQWPSAEDSVYDFLRDNQMRDGIYHLTQPLTATQHQINPELFLTPLNNTTIVDAACLSIPINDSIWATIIYLRCNDSEKFSHDTIELLNQLKPSIARLILIGLKHENQIGATTNISELMPISPLEKLEKLSKTERIVFDYLRQELTERQIAEVMSRSKHTIHVYVKNIYNKLNISSRRKLLEMYDEYDSLSVD